MKNLKRQVTIALIFGVVFSGVLLVLLDKSMVWPEPAFGHAVFVVASPGIFVGLTLWGVHSGTQLQIGGTILIVNALVYAVLCLVILTAA